jgi:hypothetical protein
LRATGVNVALVPSVLHLDAALEDFGRVSRTIAVRDDQTLVFDC